MGWKLFSKESGVVNRISQTTAKEVMPTYIVIAQTSDSFLAVTL